MVIAIRLLSMEQEARPLLFLATFGPLQSVATAMMLQVARSSISPFSTGTHAALDVRDALRP